jgi:hypothetical protein
MTVMVMNSEISGHFSKEAYGYTESELNDRYTKMNADPVASQLFEYNNTGDGAITESIENTCTYATKIMIILNLVCKRSNVLLTLARLCTNINTRTLYEKSFIFRKHRCR